MSVAVLVRVAVLIGGHPLEAADTGGYRELAARLSSGNLSGYSGLRTPGYPLIMLLLHQNTRAIWVGQLLFGVLISFAVFEATCTMSRSVRWSFVAALMYAVAPHALVYESYMLTECTTTLLMVLAFLLYVRMTTTGKPPLALHLLLLGVVVGLGILTRPMQVILLPVFCVALLTRGAGWSWASRSRAAVLFASPALALTLGWCAINKAVIGSFTLSTIAGPAMLGVTTDFIEEAGPSYRDVVSIIVPYRDSLERAAGVGSGAVWLAYGEIKKATGMSDAAVSRRLLDASLSAARRAPLKWLWAVARGWTRFWLAPGGVVRGPTGARVIGLVSAAPYVFLNFCILLLCVAVVVGRDVRRVVLASPAVSVMLGAIVLASIVQAVAEGTGGTRYAVPFEPLVFVVVAVVGAAGVNERSDMAIHIEFEPNRRT